MKRNIGVIICFILLVCTACASDKTQETILSPSMSGSPSIVEGEPLWTQISQEDGQLFQGLNLDGVGDLDDEVYISTVQFGDDDKVTVLRVHLGTGETMGKIFSVSGNYTFQTGHLFSGDKDAIVLEVSDPASNYGASHVLVLDVFNVGIDSFPQIAVRLDTTNDPVVSASNEILVDSDYITDGTQIIEVEGKPLQGLKIYSTGSQGKWREQHQILYWAGDNSKADNGWSLINH